MYIFNGTSVRKKYMVLLLNFHSFIVHIANDSSHCNLNARQPSKIGLSILIFKIFHVSKENEKIKERKKTPFAFSIS